MDPTTVHRLQKAAEAAKQAAHRARLDSCDISDLDEAIEAVDRELANTTPNRNTLALYLNSVAKSLMVIPAAREACAEIDKALRSSGLPSTWSQ